MLTAARSPLRQCVASTKRIDDFLRLRRHCVCPLMPSQNQSRCIVGRTAYPPWAWGALFFSETTKDITMKLSSIVLWTISFPNMTMVINQSRDLLLGNQKQWKIGQFTVALQEKFYLIEYSTDVNENSLK